MERSITSGFLSLVSTKVLLLLLGLASSPLLTRLLGAKYGDYAFLMSVFAIFMIFVSSGVTDGVRKFLAEQRDDPNWEEHVVGFYLRLAVFLAALGAAFLVGVVQADAFLPVLPGENFEAYFYLLAVLVVAAQFREYTRRTLMGFGLEAHSEPLRVVGKVVFLGSALTLAYLGHGVVGVLVGHVIASSVVALLGFALIHRQVSLRSVLRVPSLEFPRREMLAFNGFSILLVLLITSLFHVDILMLRPIAGRRQTQYYKIALTLAEFLWFVPLSMQMVLLHSTSKLWANEDEARISSIAARVTRYTLLLTALLAIGLAALAARAIPILYPDEYLASRVPLLLLLPGALGFAVARPILAIGQGKGELRVLITATGVAAGLNLVLNWVLIGQFGMNGAAVATSISYGSMFVLHVWGARRLGFDPLSDARLVRTMATILLSIVPIFYLATVLQNDVLALAVVPPVGLGIYLSFALLTGALGADEILSVLASFPDPVGRWTTRLRTRGDGRRTRGGTDTVTVVQTVLLVAGSLLFLTGLGVAVAGPGVGDIGVGLPGDDDETTAPPGTGTQTPTPTTAPPPTDTTTGTAQEPTRTATRTGTSTGTQTGTSEPPTRTETSTTPPPTRTATQTQTQTSTATQTQTATATQTQTETQTSTTTQTQTETQTSTTTQTATQTSTSTQTSTATQTQTSTATQTQTETTTQTTTQTSTSTDSTSTDGVLGLFDGLFTGTFGLHGPTLVADEYGVARHAVTVALG
ncbi:oligosaccharide flippase family protein [Haloarchaeobius sp. HRN-SO-5]|uniref:oligosaccharide flippase family protein n=1 Tax=Haloarchaeobius sp. HRN-SO-5 TaxID=3446118 RepID=UPI003EB98FE9